MSSPDPEGSGEAHRDKPLDPGGGTGEALVRLIDLRLGQVSRGGCQDESALGPACGKAPAIGLAPPELRGSHSGRSLTEAACGPAIAQETPMDWAEQRQVLGFEPKAAIA